MESHRTRAKALGFRPFIALFVFVVAVCFSRPVSAAAPFGSLDTADGTVIAGWARDPDYSGPIQLHIYVDDQLYDVTWANLYRSDVGWHAFHYEHSGFGVGTHSVKVFAIGTDGSGTPNGENPILSNAPRFFNVGCINLTGSAYPWCTEASLQQYWLDRQVVTKRFITRNVVVGVNTSYGGMLTQLQSADRRYNLIDEHGGAGVQLSLWAYRDSGEHADPNYGFACPGWTQSAPLNPIQGSGLNCWYEDRADTPTVNEGLYNNVVNWPNGSNGLTIHKTDPINFTKAGPFPGLYWLQALEVVSPWARVDYSITYSGSVAWYPHPQELPAIHLNLGTNSKVYYYGGTSPGAHQPVSVLPITSSITMGMLGRQIPGYTNTANNTEGWWSVCSSDDTRCVTIYTPPGTTHIWNILLRPSENGSTYASALGYFALTPSQPTINQRVFFFPYRYDAFVDGASIRQHIYYLN